MPPTWTLGNDQLMDSDENSLSIVDVNRTACTCVRRTKSSYSQRRMWVSDACVHVTPRFTTSDPLRSGSTSFEAGQRIQSWSDLNWLAVLTDAATVIDSTLRWRSATLRIWECMTTRRRTRSYAVFTWVYIQSSSTRLHWGQPHARMLRNLVLLRCSAMLPLYM